MTSTSFPPEFKPGVRVWTETGFMDHGPMDGPRQDISGPQGGVIELESKPYGPYDSSLYSVKWDNGQASKHYAHDLIPIGDSKDFENFLKRFEFVGPVSMKVGPRGGFKELSYQVNFDGQEICGITRNRRIWTRLLGPAVERQGVRVIEVPFN